MPFPLQHHFDFRNNHVNCNAVVRAARDDHVCPVLARLDKFEMHRLDGGCVLLDDRINRATTLNDIAAYAPDETFIGVRVNEDLDVEEIAQLAIYENENPFHNNDVSRFKLESLA